MKPRLSDWLALQGEIIGGCEAAFCVIGASLHAPGAICEGWPREGTPDRALATLVQLAIERGRLCVREPGRRVDSWEALTHLALPICVDGVVRGAVGVSVRAVLPGESKSIAERLTQSIDLLAGWLLSHDESARVAEMLALSTTLLDHESLPPATHELAAALARRLGCERVAIGLQRRRGVEVVALSNGVRFGARGHGTGDLCAAMEEAIDQDERIELTSALPEPGVVCERHRALQSRSGAGTLCTLPLGARNQPVGAITFEWKRDAPLDAGMRARIEELATLAGPLLDLFVRAEQPIGARARRRFAAFCERHFGTERLGRIAITAAAVTLAVIAVMPATYRVSARASLEGRVQRAVVAAVPGYLAEAHVRAGDLVEAGQLLARLDDRDLVLEQRKWRSEHAQLEREYREALALQDRSRIRIIRAQIDRAIAQLGLADEALARTKVIAPFDGIVLEGDLDRSLGSPVEQGSVLFEVAPLDGYRIIVEVDGRDIADVGIGQTGSLALSALPGESLPLRVERVTPISTVSDGRNHFRVEAALTEPRDALRPGMEGVAKIEVGQRRLFWIWTHGLLDWLRLQLWSFLP